MDRTDKLIITYFRLSEEERSSACFGGSTESILKSGRFAQGYAHMAVINDDGTVTAYGDNGSRQCDVAGWTDIVKIAAGDYHTVGLKSDGTVMAAGDNVFGQCNVGKWRNVTQLYADKGITVGMTEDGRLLCSGKRYSAPDEGSDDEDDESVVDEAEDEPDPDSTLLAEEEISGSKETPAAEFEFHTLPDGSISIDRYTGVRITVVIPGRILDKPVTEIGSLCFNDNQTVKTVVFPSSLRTIGNFSFSDCGYLETLSIPFGLTHICDYAFANCSSIKELRLPDSIKKIDYGAFYGCSSLKTVYITEETKKRLKNLSNFFNNTFDISFETPEN